MAISNISSLSYSSISSVSSTSYASNVNSSVDIDALTADSVEFSGGTSNDQGQSSALNIDALYSRKSQAQGELGDLKNKVDNSQTQINDRREEISRASQDEKGSQETNENYAAAKKELETAKTAKTQAQNDLTKANQEGTANAQAISANTQAKTVNAANLNAAQAELAALQPPAQPAGDDPEAQANYQAELAAYQVQKAALEAKINTLNAEKSKLESESQQLQTKKSQIDQTKSTKQAEVTKQDAAMQAAQQKMDAAKNQEAENNPKFKEALKNDETLQIAQQELVESQQAVAGKEAEINEIDAQIAQVEASDNAYAKTVPQVNNMLGQMDAMVGLSENDADDAAQINEITKRSGIDCSTTPWCAAYAMNMLKENGLLDTSSCENVNYCPTIESWAKEQNIWEQQGNGYEPRPGDGIIFDWQQDGTADHIGIVEKIEDGKIYTIEGNSSDAVSRCTYDLNSDVVKGFLNCSMQGAEQAEVAATESANANAAEIDSNVANKLEAAGLDKGAAAEVMAEIGTIENASEEELSLHEQKALAMLAEWSGLKGLSEHNQADAAIINQYTNRPQTQVDCSQTAWCCTMYTTMAGDHGLFDTSNLSYEQRVGCGQLMQLGQANNALRPSQAHPMAGQEAYTPKPGDAIFFSHDGSAWQGESYEDHVGAVLRIEGDEVVTLEGNAGDMVQEKRYKLNSPEISGYLDTEAMPQVEGDLGKLENINIDDLLSDLQKVEANTAGATGSAAVASSADVDTSEHAQKAQAMLAEWGSLTGLSEHNSADAAIINQYTNRPQTQVDCSQTAWCCTMYTAMAGDHGLFDTSNLSYEQRVGCGHLMKLGQANGALRPSEAHPMAGQESYTPQPGDAIFFSHDGSAWQGETYEDHVGAVLRIEGDEVVTLEGNASDMVQEKRYKLNSPEISGYLDAAAMP